MTRRQAILLGAIAITVLAMFGAVSAAAAPPSATADADAVLDWNAHCSARRWCRVGLPGPAGGAPPTSQINMGMVQGAVYDAVNAITPKHHRPYLLNRRFGNTASDDAAVATAAYLVLKNIVETVPPNLDHHPPDTGDSAGVRSAVRRSKNAIPDSPFKNQGIAAGTAAAQAMIDARQGDGRFGQSPFVPNGSPGHWDPVPPGVRRGGVRPDSVGRRRQAVPDAELVAVPSAGPLALTSAAYAKDVNEVKALGGRRRPRSERQPSRRTSPSGGRATPSRCGMTLPASSSRENLSTPRTPPGSSRWRISWRRTRRSTPGTTSTTSTSGGRFRRSAGRTRTTTP